MKNKKRQNSLEDKNLFIANAIKLSKTFSFNLLFITLILLYQVALDLSLSIHIGAFFYNTLSWKKNIKHSGNKH